MLLRCIFAESSCMPLSGAVFPFFKGTRKAAPTHHASTLATTLRYNPARSSFLLRVLFAAPVSTRDSMSALRLHYATAATQRSRVAVASTQRCVSCTATTSSSSRLVWQTVSKCERQARASSATVRAKNEPVVEDYDPEMDCEERMDKSVSSCQTELAGFRTGTYEGTGYWGMQACS